MKKSMLVVILVALGIIVLVVAFIVGLAKSRISNNTVQKTETTDAMKEPETGLLGLSTQGGKTSYKKGDEITVLAYANSHSSKVTGYDIVIHYDPNLISFNDVKSMQNGVDLLDTDLELDNGMHELIVTGVQSLSQKESFVFDGTQIAELTFTAIGTGTFDMKPIYEKGSNRESNLLDDSTNEILSGVEGVTLELK